MSRSEHDEEMLEEAREEVKWAHFEALGAKLEALRCTLKNSEQEIESAMRSFEIVRRYIPRR